jgi:hypothetical protein
MQIDTGAEFQQEPITVEVAPDVALVLHGQASPTIQSKELLQLADELGVMLEPMHPGAEDPLLIPFFVVAVQDPDRVETVRQRLSESDAVKGAYVKPPAEPAPW